jgi:hypothetical protein
MGGGSINKLTLLLQEKIVTYDTSTIDMFRMWVMQYARVPNYL